MLVARMVTDVESARAFLLPRLVVGAALRRRFPDDSRRKRNELAGCRRLSRVDFEEYSRAQLPGLVRFAAALTGDTELAQDLVQDALIRAYARWSRVSKVDRPDLYLRRVVINGYLSWRRRWYQRTVGSVADMTVLSRPMPTDPVARLADADQIAALLSTLDRRKQVAIVLRFFEDRDDAEIAEMLGCAQGTVRSHISRGLAALRPLLHQELAEGVSYERS